MLNKIIATFFISIISIFYANSQIANGAWRTHFSYAFANQIEESPNKIYCLSNGNLFSFHKSQHILEKLNKVNGLNDIVISTIKFIPDMKMMVVGYDNGNIDLILESEIINIPEIKREIISGGKCINRIDYFDTKAYLSADFGIVVLDLLKREIKETYFVGENGRAEKVNDILIKDNFIYALLNEEIKFASLSNFNLIDYNSWTTSDLSALSNIELLQIQEFNGKFLLQVIENDTTHSIYESSDLNDFNAVISSLVPIHNFRTSENQMIVSFQSKIEVYDQNYQQNKIIDYYQWGGLNARDALMDSENNIWIAQYGNGLLYYKGNESAKTYFPNGPYSNHSFKISSQNGKVYNIGGSVNDIWSGVYLEGKLYRFDDEVWYNTNNWQTNDYVTLAIDPSDNNHLFTGSWGFGVYEYQNFEIINHFNPENSPLSSIFLGQNLCRIGGMAYDSNHNLWVVNSGVDNPLSVLKSDQTWQTFQLGSKVNAPTASSIIIDDFQTKWIILPRGYGLFAFNENKTIDDVTDDLSKKISINDNTGSVISNDVFSIAKDKKGDIWLGTNQGVVVYYYPENVFENSGFYASRILVEFDGQLDYLLKYETILSIAVDGANRKWIGTQSSGVFLVSETGTEQILHFSEENSPLISNAVNSIAINDQTGEVFFGTDKGIISYRGSATEGSSAFKNVYAYPNPVRPDYFGDVHIAGLKTNTSVKIIDISGNIVYETSSLGGQAVWDGTNLNGKRVKTGVYIVLLSDENEQEFAVTKIVFIN